MEHKDFEQLYVRFLDEVLTTVESLRLTNALREDPTCARIAKEHDRVRETVKRKNESSFGSDFTSSVMKALQQGIQTFDSEIAFLFKKVYLLAAGVIICLLIVNVVYADEFSVPSVLAWDSTAAPQPVQEVNDDIVLDISELINTNE
jgi:hypothetical protein